MMRIGIFNHSRRDLGVYIHYPFCKRMCNYCDFFKQRYTPEGEKYFLENLEKEIQLLKELFSHSYSISSLYLGGGSPSIASPEFFKVLGEIFKHFKINSDFEFTIEINPEDLSGELLMLLKQVGINRISLGIQSFHSDVLKFLGRGYDISSLKRFYSKINGITENISFDLLFGFDDKFSRFHVAAFDMLDEFNPKHISLYALTVYGNTPLASICKKGSEHLIDEEHISERYSELSNLLESKGYFQYEVSNFAQPGFECRHNLRYWQLSNFIGLGPSASSHFFGLEWKNLTDLGKMRTNLDKSQLPTDKVEKLKTSSYLFEKLFLSLRLRKSISISGIAKQLRHKEEEFLPLLKGFESEGLLEISDSGKSFHLTNRGLFLSEEIFLELTSHLD